MTPDRVPVREQEKRPDEVEFRAAQRVRVVLEFTENEQVVHAAEKGWARIDGPWLHFFSDENDDFWQSWPMQNVVCVDWEVLSDGS